MAKWWRRGGKSGGGDRWQPKKYYEEFAERITEQIKEGVAPWQKPWKPGERALPENFRSGRPYHGSNAVHFAMVATEKGYSDNRWGTYNQIKAAGGYVRRGEKAATGTYMSYTKKEPVKDEDGKPQKDEKGRTVYVEIPRDRPIPVPFKVFNVEQAGGLRLPQRDEAKPDWDPHAAAERVIRASGVDFRHKAGDRAFYQVDKDRVVMPPRSQFADAGRYYQTAMHELGHAAGHEDRMDAESLKEAAGGRFGSPAYAREELRAEISGLMTNTRLGVGHNPRHGAAYVEAWAAALKDNPREILFASSEAQGRSDYLINQARELERREAQDHASEIGAKMPGPSPDRTAQERFQYRGDDRTATITRPAAQAGTTEQHRRHTEQGHYLVTMEHRGREGKLTAWAKDSDDAHEKARRWTATGVAPTWSEHHPAYARPRKQQERGQHERFEMDGRWATATVGADRSRIEIGDNTGDKGLTVDYEKSSDALADAQRWVHTGHLPGHDPREMERTFGKTCPDRFEFRRGERTAVIDRIPGTLAEHSVTANGPNGDSRAVTCPSRHEAINIAEQYLYVGKLESRIKDWSQHATDHRRLRREDEGRVAMQQGGLTASIEKIPGTGDRHRVGMAGMGTNPIHSVDCESRGEAEDVAAHYLNTGEIAVPAPERANSRSRERADEEPSR